MGREKRLSCVGRRVRVVGWWLQGFCLFLVQGIYWLLWCFFYDILYIKYCVVIDVYVFMFLVDVVDFIIIIFGFWVFGKYLVVMDIMFFLLDDQVFEVFLVMLLIQFSIMVVDCVFYLCKIVLGKLVFQVVLVLVIYLWMFFILFVVIERMFSQNVVVQLWYFVKCIYFVLFVYQICCGYFICIFGNFFIKKYNYFNFFFFQGFWLVLFLVELWVVMDWVWMDIMLFLFSWMCVEDIYVNIFIIKCS